MTKEEYNRIILAKKLQINLGKTLCHWIHTLSSNSKKINKSHKIFR